MKARLILDSLGPNPAYSPPDRTAFATDEEWHDALALYDVSPDVTIPAGTLLTGPQCWMHCFPDASGVIMTKGRDDTGRITIIPKRVGVGVVRAIPEDDACRAALARQIKVNASVRRISVAEVEAEIAQAVAEAQAEQAANAASAPATEGGA